MSLYQQILYDLKSAMLQKDSEKTLVLRSIKTAIIKKEISERTGGIATLSASDIIQILQKEAKQRKDSFQQFSDAGRTDLADKEQVELAIIESYLPKMMTESEINVLIDQIFERLNPQGPADMGKVMGSLMPLVRGKADGSVVNKLVKERLA